MHDGCAASLIDIFVEPTCGGDAHGEIGSLDTDEIQTLVNWLYLQ